MKQIILGTTYNTETSKQVGVRCKDMSSGKLIAETLYKAKDGHYFLYESDILSKNRSAGRIIPLNAEDANAWAKKNLGEYAYAAEFGRPQPGPGKANTPKILSITLPPDLIRRLEQLQSEQGKTMSQVIESLLRKDGLPD